eukprot:gene28640-50515_t
MKGLNKVTLIGNLGNNPEINILDKDIKVAKFSLATSETYKDDKGQKHTITDWHNIVLWRGLADLAQNFLHKGSLAYIEGKLKTRSYDDKDGRKVYVTEVIGEQILLLDKKTDNNHELNIRVKKLVGVRWSQTHKAWYVLDSAFNREKFCLTPKALIGKEVLSQIHPVNQMALQKYVETLQLKAYSLNTITTYKNEFAQ